MPRDPNQTDGVSPVRLGRVRDPLVTAGPARKPLKKSVGWGSSRSCWVPSSLNTRDPLTEVNRFPSLGRKSPNDKRGGETKSRLGLTGEGLTPLLPAIKTGQQGQASEAGRGLLLELSFAATGCGAAAC